MYILFTSSKALQWFRNTGGGSEVYAGVLETWHMNSHDNLPSILDKHHDSKAFIPSVSSNLRVSTFC